MATQERVFRSMRGEKVLRGAAALLTPAGSRWDRSRSASYRRAGAAPSSATSVTIARSSSSEPRRRTWRADACGAPPSGRTRLPSQRDPHGVSNGGRARSTFLARIERKTLSCVPWPLLLRVGTGHAPGGCFSACGTGYAVVSSRFSFSPRPLLLDRSSRPAGELGALLHRRGIGAVISSTPFSNVACTSSALTPSGSGCNGRSCRTNARAGTSPRVPLDLLLALALGWSAARRSPRPSRRPSPCREDRPE